MAVPMKIRGAPSTVLALTVAFVLVGAGAAYGQVAEEPEPTAKVERACENPTHSRVLLIGSGFAPNAQLLATGVIVADGEIVLFVEDSPFSASADGTFELEAEWEGPARYDLSVRERSFFPPFGPSYGGSLFVDCSKPVAKQECKKDGWRAFGFKNQGRCVASVQRARR